MAQPPVLDAHVGIQALQHMLMREVACVVVVIARRQSVAEATEVPTKVKAMDSAGYEHAVWEP